MKNEVLVKISDMSLRIRKVMRNNPEMTNAQVARKIGRDNPEGRERVQRERLDTGPERLDGFPECSCGGLFDMCVHCLQRRGVR